MTRSLRRLFYTTLFLVVFALSPLAAESKQAPGFSLTDHNGKAVSLEDFEGYWIHLDFSADWCYWCHFQAGYMSMAERLLQQRDVDNFVSITILSQDDQGGPPSRAVLRKWIDDYRLDHVLADPDGEITGQYPVNGYPTNVIVSPELEIVEYWAGSYQTADDFVTALKSSVPEMFN